MSSPVCRQDVALSRMPDRPGYVDVTLSFKPSSEVTGVQPTIPNGADVESTVGFVERGGQYHWDGTTDRPTMELEVPVREHGAAGRSQADTGEWALIQAPQVAPTLRRRSTGSIGSFGDAFGSQLSQLSSLNSLSDILDRRFHVHDRGFASSDGAVVYLGPYDAYNRRVGDHVIRLVVPYDAELSVEPERIMDALEDAARAMDVRGKNKSVLGVAAPSDPVNWGPEGQKRGTSGFWVRDSSPLKRANCTWIHEYVHTRQAFDTAPETKWLVEGTAVFYATYHGHQQGLISDADFQRALNTSQFESDILANPHGGWSSALTPYKKGARVVAWIDREISEATNGRIRFDAAMRGLNLRDEQITLADLKHDIAAAMGTSQSAASFRDFAQTLERVVKGPDTPPTVGPPGKEPLPESEIPSTGAEVIIEDFLEELTSGDGTIDEGEIFTTEALEPDLFAEDELFIGRD